MNGLADGEDLVWWNGTPPPGRHVSPPWHPVGDDPATGRSAGRTGGHCLHSPWVCAPPTKTSGWSGPATCSRSARFQGTLPGPDGSPSRSRSTGSPRTTPLAGRRQSESPWPTSGQRRPRHDRRCRPPSRPPRRRGPTARAWLSPAAGSNPRSVVAVTSASSSQRRSRCRWPRPPSWTSTWSRRSGSTCVTAGPVSSGLADRGVAGVLAGVDVPTGLQPQPQAAMPVQRRVRPPGINDDGGCGDVDGIRHLVQRTRQPRQPPQDRGMAGPFTRRGRCVRLHQVVDGCRGVGQECPPASSPSSATRSSGVRRMPITKSPNSANRADASS
jgi:hypothetical protein